MKMTVSYEWLCDLIPNLNQHQPEKIGLALTAIGAETENVSLLNYGQNCELSKVINIEKLNKVSKLTVECASGKYIVISNSPDISLDEYVIFAPLNSTIFGNHPVTSKKIEEVSTEGLLLALENLGIEPKSTDICLLGKDEKTAQELFDTYCALDAIYTLDVPGNRPDWLSVRELARALAIYFELDLKEYSHSLSTSGTCDLPIKIESERCARYSLRKISNVHSIQTPAIFKKRLYLLGMRPISYLVDISNIAMLELGQPTHAFDSKKIKGSIIIRQAKNGEQITLLDETQLTLTQDDLLICDEEKTLALAGIMGGLDSGVDETTTDIYLESASFNGVWVRRSAKRLGLKTESSLRFEKNTSPNLALQAQDFIASTITQDIPTANISTRTDVFPNPSSPSIIHISVDDINSYLGTDIPADWIKTTISKLGCELNTQNDIWEIQSTRNDLKIKEDIIEEVARFYGYDNIPSTSFRPSSVQLTPEKSFDERIRPILRGMGLNEVVTVAFRSKENLAFYNCEKNAVSILNPLNIEWTELRTHIFDGLLEILKHNINKAFEKNNIFSEIASVFTKTNTDSSEESFHEEKHLAFLVSQESNNYQKALNFLHNILAYSKISNVKATPNKNLGFLHPLNSFEIYLDNQFLGFFGEVHPTIVEKLDLSDKKEFPAPVVGELNFDILKSYADINIPVSPIPELPPVLRDITLSVNEDVLGINLIPELKSRNPFLKEVELLSVFQNDALKNSKKKNISLRLRFESDTQIDIQAIDEFIKQLLSE